MFLWYGIIAQNFEVLKMARKVAAAADILGDLAAMVPPPPAKNNKAQKWEMELTPEATEWAIKWVEGKVSQEAINPAVDNAKAEFMEYALKVMAKKIQMSKNQPSNPMVYIKADGKVDHQFQVTMTDKFKIRLPDVPEGVGAVQHYVDVFTNLGLHPNDAKNLVEEELDFNPITSLATLTSLLDGVYGEKREFIESTDEQKSAGLKLVNFLKWDGNGPAPEPLTVGEKVLILERSNSVKVKAGFYNRICNYARTVDQILAVFKVIQPIIYPVYAKFAVNDNEVERHERKMKAFASIIGAEVKED